ncbi:MAG TPA: peptidoglycan-binding domain-containing protein, partial [Chitinispirillaceae bacterium]|nr:peptidoglycan-binding domain-containing protein [Chitinispirillaceae bacterium]
TVGPKTKSAVKGFKMEAKARYNLNVTSNDIVDDDTWCTIFQVYTMLILEQMQSTALPCLKFTYDTGNGMYACGESFPIDSAQKTNYKSQANRRVEIVFGKPGFFDCMPQPDKNKILTRDQCPVLNHESYVWTLIPNEVLSSNLLCKACIQDPVEGGIASIQVTIHFEDGSTVSKTTDSKGCLEFECTKDQKFVKFEYKRGNKTHILEYFPRPAPVDTDDGIWQRLVNLGYWGEGDAPLSPSKEQLQAVVQAFQMDFEIDATGKMDAETQDKLVEQSSENKYWKDESFSSVENYNDDKPKEKVA